MRDQLSSMTVGLLRCFLAAAEEEHFGRAADRMHIVVPAFSRQIRKLENMLEVRLFDRAGRGVVLSPAGRIYADRARSILQALDEAGDAARQSDQAGRKPVSFGLQEHVGVETSVIDILQRLRAALPPDAITLKVMNSQEQFLAIADSRLDMGIVYGGPGRGAALHRLPILTDRIVLAVPRAHRLATAATVHLRDIAGEDFIALESGAAPGIIKRVEEACRSGGIELNIAYRAEHAAGVYALVASGAGISFCPGILKPPANMRTVPIVDLDVTVPCDFVWRRDEKRLHVLAVIEAVRGIMAARPLSAAQKA